VQNIDKLGSILSRIHGIKEDDLKFIQKEFENQVQIRTCELEAHNQKLLQEIAEQKKREEQAQNMAVFPEENPNPVFRVSGEGKILYANSASNFILEKWETGVGQVIPEIFRRNLSAAFEFNQPIEVEERVSDQYFSFVISRVKGKEYANVYAKEITERKKAEEASLYAKDEAEKANKAKSDFLSKMSHELRTPLNAILGFSQLLEINFENNLTPLQKENIGHILKAGNHLLDLINEVLDLAKVESGNITLDLQPINIANLIEEMGSIFQPMANEYGIRLSILLDPSMNLTAHADKLRLKQILLNLVSNAIKYNHPGGSVSVSCKALNSKVLQVDFIDTGPGISIEDQSKLFEPFNRLGNEHSHVEGTGIGLTVTKELVELMGGSIGLTSRLGEGSHFHIKLPVAKKTETRNSQLNKIFFF
jgi:signal transduction histidine kinase